MRYLHKNEKGEPVALPVKVRLGDDHKEFYVHGAAGGFLANYHYRIDFYRDDVPALGEYVIENSAVTPDSITAVNRRILTTLYLSPSFVKELKNWLDKNIAQFESEYGEIQKPIGEEEDQSLPKVKEA